MAVPAVAPNLAFQEGISNFSFSLYGAIERSGNEFISPYSISAALLLLSLGTGGTTKKQILSSMFTTGMVNDVHMGYKTLNTKIESRANTGVTLSVANRLFASDRFTILQKYITDSLTYYGSEVQRLDFTTQAEQSRVLINNWISTQTHDKIRDMMPKGKITSNTIMVLTNAIYFKGMWKRKFDARRTIKKNFKVGPYNQMQVDMMHDQFKAMSGEHTALNCKVLQLPYSGDQVSMVLILPNDKNGLTQLENRLTFAKFQELLSGLRKQDTIIRIPKFKVEESYDLKPILRHLGISEIFDRTTANFTKMVLPQLNSHDVYVSDARHKSYIEVNEESSEAAAATTLEASFKSALINPTPPFEFIADHPFMLVILDNETKTTLFMGRYAEP
jgi:serine protease inhibitor